VRNNQFAQSALWKHINETKLAKNQIKTMDNFKSSGVNFKLSLWNPQTNGVRYLKTLIYNLCANLDKNDWKIIRNIRNRNIGDPISVKYNGEDICLDYLQALYELRFINKAISLDNRNIVEIGAGYGRTCHALMDNHKIRSYYIIDLENCLELSRKYLKSALSPSKFSRIKFVLADDMNRLEDAQFDLCLNIDSFAEMDQKVVKNYLDYINQHCKYFYVKNPIGKYYDKSLDNHNQGLQMVKLALKTGILREIVNIDDNRDISMHAGKYMRAYLPGKKWSCLAKSWAPPWSYYWQAMYKKRRERK